MHLRLLTVIVAALLTAAACSSGAGEKAVIDRSQDQVETTAAPTTTPPASTTTTEPDPAAAKAVTTAGGIVVPVVTRATDGWTIRTPCHATAMLNQARAKSVASPVVVLDPGHGGAEPGAVSPSGLAEKGVNLEVARHAQAALQEAGVDTILTRTGDYEVALATRSEIARSVDPKAFVSIHHNAEPDGPRDGPGAETYYQIGSADSKRLAGLLYEEIVKAMSQYEVAWVADRDAGAKYRPGSSGDYYAMLRQPGKVVSVLAELAFISNPPEAELIARPDVQRVEGDAVARGIIRYLTTKDPGSGFTEPYPREDPPRGPTGPGRPCRDPQL